MVGTLNEQSQRLGVTSERCKLKILRSKWRGQYSIPFTNMEKKLHFPCMPNKTTRKQKVIPLDRAFYVNAAIARLP